VRVFPRDSPVVPYPCFGAIAEKKAKLENAVFKGGYRENRDTGQKEIGAFFTDEVALRLKT
jgi:hypothetical protein